MFAYVMAAVLATGPAAATPLPLTWEASYGKALETTRSEGQPLLVVLDDPHSGNARIEPALLSEGATEGAAVEMLRPYRLCHVDVSTEYGKKVAEAFQAKAFPHVAIIDKTGAVIIHSRSGAIAAQDWTQLLTTYKSGDRSLATVSRVSYKPNQSLMFQNPSSGYIINGSCPNCVRRSY